MVIEVITLKCVYKNVYLKVFMITIQIDGIYIYLF